MCYTWYEAGTYDRQQREKKSMDNDFLIEVGQQLNQRRPEPTEPGAAASGPTPRSQTAESPFELLLKARKLGERADSLSEKIQSLL